MLKQGTCILLGEEKVVEQVSEIGGSVVIASILRPTWLGTELLILVKWKVLTLTFYLCLYL